MKIEENENKTEIFEAKEAKRLSELNQKQNLEKVFNMIKYSIQEGKMCCSFRPGLSLNQINELMNLGYGVRKHIDQIMGEEFFVISW